MGVIITQPQYTKVLGFYSGTWIKQRTKAYVSFLQHEVVFQGKTWIIKILQNKTQNAVLRLSKHKAMRLKGGDLYQS